MYQTICTTATEMSNLSFLWKLRKPRLSALKFSLVLFSQYVIDRTYAGFTQGDDPKSTEKRRRQRRRRKNKKKRKGKVI